MVYKWELLSFVNSYNFQLVESYYLSVRKYAVKLTKFTYNLSILIIFSLQ